MHPVFPECRVKGREPGGCDLPGSLPNLGVSQRGPVDKLKRNGFLYGIHIISIAGGHFYDGKTKRTNPDGNP